MFIDQLSLFVENKPGRLIKITKALANANVDMRAFSVADTSDFAILRLIVDNTEKALDVLNNEGIAVTVSKVIGLGIDDKPGSFAGILEILSEANISVEYLYAFISHHTDKAYFIFRVDREDDAVELFKKNNVLLLSTQDIANL